jgi:hypothetical protein
MDTILFRAVRAHGLILTFALPMLSNHAPKHLGTSSYMLLPFGGLVAAALKPGESAIA